MPVSKVTEHVNTSKRKRRKRRVAFGSGAHWFRSWRSKIHSAKVWKLSPDQYRTWDFLLCLTDARGYLPPLDAIAHHLRLTPTDAERRICDLVELRFIDPEFVAGCTIYRMHDWDRWQPATDHSTARVRAHRKRRISGLINSDETVMKRLRNEYRSDSSKKSMGNATCSAPNCTSLGSEVKGPSQEREEADFDWSRFLPEASR